ncbi:MAG: LysM peptidoglycan-binding domain-containing protein [Prolixibacteraceae bacterium]|nr:LysM peptidoglycan-binding domain-containing protein [Prolixibacteraceae bacterium]
MNILNRAILLSFFLVLNSLTYAQQLKENEIVVIHGEKFVLHQVRTGETIFSITRKFKVDSLQLMQNNPGLAEGLKIGDILKIPYHTKLKLKEKPVYEKGDPTGFVFHKIKSRKETPYFIAKKYGITVEQIYSYNPEVRRFRIGTKLRIPRWDKPLENKKATPVVTKQNSGENIENDLIEYIVKSGETIYSLTKKFHVSENEILFYNPGAKNLKAGAKIYLPKAKGTPAVQESIQTATQTGQFFEHILESGETMYGITRKYGVTQQELMALNPVLEKAFPAGVTIKIPVKEATRLQVLPKNDEAFNKHLVQKGETLYGLSAKYNLPITGIKKFNPVLEKRNLVYGETILIPRKTEADIEQFMGENKTDSALLVKDFYKVEVPVEIPESCRPEKQSPFLYKPYEVALFLPLFLEANDTLNKKEETVELQDSLSQSEMVVDTSEIDTLIDKKKREDLFKGFYRGSENFLQFYEGVLTAVDSMQRAGMNIHLSVFDTQRNLDSVRQFIFTDSFLETDLIIGPVYGEVQKEVAEIAFKNRIPMISPLASRSGLINSNPYFYQVNPSRNYLASETAEMVAEEYYNSNFIVFRTNNFEGTPEGKLVNLFREKFYNSGFWGLPNGVTFRIYDFKNDGPFGFRSLLSHTKENVVYIPSSNEGVLSVAISNINNLSDEYSITLIGSSIFQRFKSIDVEEFHNLKLKFVAPYWVDYNQPATINFIRQFKNNFFTEPNSFGIQGYDVSFYFLNALKNYGKEFNDCLPYLYVNLIQGTYHFEKVSEFGGFMNQGVSVISYTRDYQVKRTRIKGQPKLVAGN